MKATFISLGCPKNVVDLETILGRLDGQLEWTKDPRYADVTIINTCAFIDAAKEEAIDIILEIAELKKTNPAALLLVCGCMAQRYKERLAEELPEIDAVFNSVDPEETAREISRYLRLSAKSDAPRKPLTPAHSAYLKIAEGCDNRCRYCAIPLIKGRFRSRNHEEVVAEAHLLAERGVRELILVAQDTTYYGHDRQQDHALSDLLADLNQVPNLAWIRVLYTHPQHWTDRLIEHFAELPRVVKAIDLPIQHINDRVLASMGRHNRRKDLEALLQSLRTRIPGVALRTSLIVGYPGETESEFQELVEFVESFEFDRLGVFTYSHEENTPAYRLEDNIPAAEKTARQEELMLLQAEISEAKNQKLLQKTIPVLIDEWDADRRVSVGRTYRDAPEVDNSVLIPDQLGQGRFYPVLIRSVEMYDLFGIPNGNPIDLPPAGWE